MIEPDMFSIVPANLDDLSAIVAIYNSTIASRQVTADTEPVTVEQRQNWFNDHQQSELPIYVVRDHQDTIQGWFSFSHFYGRPAYQATCELSLYLAESCRGQGLGSRLLPEIERYARHHQLKVLLGFIFSHNIPSLKLFEKCGYEHWGELPAIAEMDGNQYGLTIVGKRVD